MVHVPCCRVVFAIAIAILKCEVHRSRQKTKDTRHKAQPKPKRRLDFGLRSLLLRAS
jgi:hypothetical protein